MNLARLIEINMVTVRSLPRLLRRSPVRTARYVGEALTVAEIVSEYAVSRNMISTPDLASSEILRYEWSALGSTRVI